MINLQKISKQFLASVLLLTLSTELMLAPPKRTREESDAEYYPDNLALQSELEPALRISMDPTAPSFQRRTVHPSPRICRIPEAMRAEKQERMRQAQQAERNFLVAQAQYEDFGVRMIMTNQGPMLVSMMQPQAPNYAFLQVLHEQPLPKTVKQTTTPYEILPPEDSELREVECFCMNNEKPFASDPRSSDVAVKMHCGHIFHESCILKNMREAFTNEANENLCPNCRAKIQTTETHEA